MCSACYWGKASLVMPTCWCYAGQLSEAHAAALASCSSCTLHCEPLQPAVHSMGASAGPSRRAHFCLESGAEQGILPLCRYSCLPFEADPSCWLQIPNRDARSLLQSMLARRPEQRANMATVLASPLFTAVQEQHQ